MEYNKIHYNQRLKHLILLQQQTRTHPHYLLLRPSLAVDNCCGIFSKALRFYFITSCTDLSPLLS